MIKDELYNFFFSLDEEKETFLKKSMNNEEYNELVKELVGDTIFVVTAWKNDSIIGVDGINRKKIGMLSNIIPMVIGYTVVKKNYQSQGIGTQMSIERQKGLEKLLVYHESIVKKHNTKMININKKENYKTVYEDDIFVYSIITYNEILLILNPIIISIYIMYKRIHNYLNHLEK